MTQSRAASNDVASQTGRAFVGIRELLLRGDVKHGERISELPLVERLGMSRTPIRLALERLAHVGLLDVGANGGFLVRIFTIAEVRDAIELRGVVEGTAARLAAERLMGKPDIERLEKHLAEVDRHDELSVDSFPDYMDSNESFHAAILDVARSDMLRRLVEHTNSLPFASPSAMVFPTSQLAVSDETLTLARQQHHGIFEAIRNREGTRAEHLGREHARLAWNVFERALARKDVFSGVPGGMLIDVTPKNEDASTE
jgi:GntR family transcriptional regulator of vanillate catabolism